MTLKKVWFRSAAAEDSGAQDSDANTGVRCLSTRRPSEPAARESASDAAQPSPGATYDRMSGVVERVLQADPEPATTLVVMEAGASWPAWVKELQRRAPNSMVEVQPSSEPAERFAARVQRRLSSLEARGVSLLGVAYAAASPASEEERAVRRALCEALLQHLSPTGELVLSGDGWSSWGVDARSREELVGLAGDLSCRLRGRNQTVSVRFSEPVEEESGVHKAPGLADILGPYGRRARAQSA